jgi:hypothetical protein
MANWDNISEKGDVEDRRGTGRRASVVGGISITGLILVLAVGYFGGQEQAFDLFSQMQESSQTQEAPVSNEFDGMDSYEKFA